MKRFYLVFMLWGSMSLYGCETCGVTSEPTLTVATTNGTPMNTTKVRAIGTTKEIVAQTAFSASTVLTLPINLNANSTTYILEQPTRQDTLTVFYKKRIYNVSTKCGYILDLIEPDSGPQIKSTFKAVDIRYDRYYNKVTGLSGGLGGEGIIILIKDL